MSENVIELRKISKSIRRVNIVSDISWSVKRGHIVGLIGPNGAGKTTILKMLAGLARADKGEIMFFGSKTNLDRSRRRMSFMLEEPILDPLMTAKNNMRYIAKVKGIKNAEKPIEEILTLVGLQNEDRKMVNKFSLGMKQRLGIGMALLNQPDVLVLDEPMNGLDPEGIVEIRNFLRELAEKKKVTIVLSSHILSEMEELCTDYVILCKGRVMEAASVKELEERNKHRIIIRTNDIERTRVLLEKQFAITKYEVNGNGELILLEYPEQIECIPKVMMEAGLSVYKFSCEEESLEQYYLSKVGATNG